MYYDSKSGKLPRKTQSCANIFKEDYYEVYDRALDQKNCIIIDGSTYGCGYHARQDYIN